MAVEDGSDPDLQQAAVMERALVPSNPPGIYQPHEQVREQLEQEVAALARYEEQESEAAEKFQDFERAIEHSVHTFQRDGIQFLQREEREYH